MWRAALDVDEAGAARLHEALEKKERGKADAHRCARTRNRFIAARGILRVILGRYLGCDPGGLRLALGPHGKPRLAADGDTRPLCFNLSHSSATALYAFASGRDVGIDVECIRAKRRHLAIAKRFFSVREFTALRGLPEGEREQAFIACWTRKEAYAKARGEGLSLPFCQWSVLAGEDGELRLEFKDGRKGDSGSWSFAHLPMPSGYAATLAVEGQGFTARLWQWNGAHW